LARIEAALGAVVERLDRRAEIDEALGVLTAGLAEYRQRILGEVAARQEGARRSHILERLSHDAALGFPHRKLVECLLAQRELSTGSFAALSFSRLVRLARVGKSRSKAYLADLEARGFVSRRHDGYRTWYALVQPQDLLA
jgi:hypothetical protein